MRKLLLLICLIILLTGCVNQNTNGRKVDISEENSDSYPVDEDIVLDDNQINIEIGNITYSATLYDNETAQAFKSNLPITLEMEELNGNEKFSNLSFTLPSNPENFEEIKAGDLMLYTTDCLVLFYKTFPTDYSYTKIGYIDDPKGLEEAVGKGNIEVTFR